MVDSQIGNISEKRDHEARETEAAQKHVDQCRSAQNPIARALRFANRRVFTACIRNGGGNSGRPARDLLPSKQETERNAHRNSNSESSNPAPR